MVKATRMYLSPLSLKAGSLFISYSLLGNHINIVIYKAYNIPKVIHSEAIANETLNPRTTLDKASNSFLGNSIHFYNKFPES